MSTVLRGLGAAQTPNYSIDDILKYVDNAKKPSGFRRFLGAVAGGAANIFAPGLGSVVGKFIGGGGALGSTGLLGESSQFLELQRQMQMETRAFETASNVMKARHDAAMSSIRNIR